jgi:hypothetical protein
MTNTTALPLPTPEYSLDYMNRLVRQLNFAIAALNSVRPVTVGSDLTSQSAAFPISGLTIVNVPVSPNGLPAGSVWSNNGVLQITS